MSHTTPSIRSPSTPSSGIWFSLFSLYLIWGSTYLGIRFAVQDIPPFLMAGTRFLIAGAIMYGILRLRGEAHPTRVQWISAGKVGVLLMLGGNGLVTFAEKLGVSSGLAATVIAIMPLWAALFSGLFGRWPSPLEWAGMGLGTLGIVLLSSDGNLKSNPIGLLALLGATATWALGSVWSRHLEMPKNLMAPATEMMLGSLPMIAIGLFSGERITTMPGPLALGSYFYLISFGSIIAFSAYMYLTARVSSTVATSYAYVNPVVALLLGALFAHEIITPQAMIAMPLILGAVALVGYAQRQKK